MSNMKNRVREMAETFAQGVIDALAEEMSAAFEGVSATPTKRAATAAQKPVRAKRSKGAKRSPELLARTVEALEKAIRAEPGLGIEKLGAALQIPTTELALPMKKLVAAGAVRSTGAKRATKYFPAGAKTATPKKPKKKKTTSKKAPKKSSKKKPAKGK